MDDYLLVLKVIDGDVEFEQSVSSELRTISIGRHPDNIVVIANSTAITRHHAEIKQDQGGNLRLGLGISVRDASVSVDGERLEISAENTDGVLIATGQLLELANDVQITLRKISTPTRIEMKKLALDEIGTHLVCSVCYDIAEDPRVIIPCMHKFCGTCIARWRKEQNTCPKCRRNVESLIVDPDLTELVGIIKKAISTMALADTSISKRKRSSIFSSLIPEERSFRFHVFLFFFVFLACCLFEYFVKSHFFLFTACVMGYIYLKL